MDKIKESQTLVDILLDDCSCNPDQKGKDQNKVAFQKDTLFDDPTRMVKDKENDDPNLNPVPNTESAKPVTGNDLFKLRRGLGRKEYQRNQKKEALNNMGKGPVKTEGEMVNTLEFWWSAKEAAAGLKKKAKKTAIGKKLTSTADRLKAMGL